MEALKQIIEESFGLRPEHFPPEVQNFVDEVIKLLQQGKLRVAEKIDGNWVTHEWIKKAVLLSFQLYPNKMVRAGDLSPASIIFPSPIGKNPASAVFRPQSPATAATSLRVSC